MAYSESIQYLQNCLTLISNSEYEEGSREAGMMEAYLPIDDSEIVEDINTVAGRFVTRVSYLSDEKYSFSGERERFIENLLVAGNVLVEAMKSGYTTELEDAMEALVDAERCVEIDGEIERVPENSSWGRIVADYLDPVEDR